PGRPPAPPEPLRQGFRPGNAQGMTIVRGRGIQVQPTAMVASKKNAFVRWALAAPVVALGAWGATGCSSSSSPDTGFDSGVVDASQNGDAALGVVVPNCNSCSATSTCGG